MNEEFDHNGRSGILEWSMNFLVLKKSNTKATRILKNLRHSLLKKSLMLM